MNNIQKQKKKLIHLLASDIIIQQEYREAIQQDVEKLNTLLQTKSELIHILLHKGDREKIKQIKKELVSLRKLTF